MKYEKVIRNVRQQSNAGWFVGGLVFCIDNAECWDKDSFYYPTEEALVSAYPMSISIEEAINRARIYKWTKM